MKIIDLLNKIANSKDYKDIPKKVKITTGTLNEKYSKEEWFKKAWEEYRQHILSSSMDDMKMPGYVFNKYLESKGE